MNAIAMTIHVRGLSCHRIKCRGRCYRLSKQLACCCVKLCTCASDGSKTLSCICRDQNLLRFFTLEDQCLGRTVGEGGMHLACIVEAALVRGLVLRPPLVGQCLDQTFAPTTRFCRRRRQ